MPPHVGLRSGLGACLYCFLPVPNLLPCRLTMPAAASSFLAVFAGLLPRLEGTVYILYHQNESSTVQSLL